TGTKTETVVSTNKKNTELKDNGTSAENSGLSGDSGNIPESAGTATAASTTAVTEIPAVETEPVSEPETKKFDAEITFDENVSVDGINAEADGSTVRITAGGDYIVRGYCSDGQIYINTAEEEKVEITFDGLNISCSYGPAVFVDNAKRCVVKLAEGSVNYLSDSGNDKINDGAIFSNDTLRIKGDGYLEINAGNAHGIASDDDVIIESGDYLINSKKSGIIANDNITLNGGTMVINSGTNGLKSKGTMNINGGTHYICGGVKEEKSSVYSAAGLYYAGGYVYAAGNMVTAPADSVNPYIVVNWKNGVESGNTVGFVLGGNEFASLTPENPFRCVMMLAPDIVPGAIFSPYLNGENQGEFTVSEGQNLYTIEI
ncbi:MAG: carbohydrate-binding domain-containing protein, partial [Ruminococcus sp.]|nr:carbohydrate-binding domain-containing protein [Ruminococcus sp.]